MLSVSRGKDQVFKQCSGCKAVRFFEQRYQILHWSSHKRLCQAIEHLETQKRLRVERGDGYVFASHLTPKRHVAVANRVGKMCKVSCVLNGVPVEALWDTGAQVSIASKSWLGEYLPSLKYEGRSWTNSSTRRFVLAIRRFVVSSCRLVVLLWRFVVSARRFLKLTRPITSSIRRLVSFVVSSIWSFRHVVSSFRHVVSSFRHGVSSFRLVHSERP